MIAAWAIGSSAAVLIVAIICLTVAYVLTHP